MQHVEGLTIACAPGGTRGAFVGGFLERLHRKFEVQPGRAVAASCSIPNVLYGPCTLQYDQGKRIWTKEIVGQILRRRTPQIWFGELRTTRLVRHIFQSLNPINIPALLETQTEYSLAIRDKNSRQVWNVTNADVAASADPERLVYDVVEAGVAVPMYTKPVFIEEKGRMYEDAAFPVLGLSLQSMVKRELKSHPKQNFIIGVDGHFEKEAGEVHRTIAESRVMLVRNTEVRSDIFDDDKPTLTRLYHAGEKAAEESKALENFFSGRAHPGRPLTEQVVRWI
jgi:predicted acylesterase/phospholipase RssA